MEEHTLLDAAQHLRTTLSALRDGNLGIIRPSFLIVSKGNNDDRRHEYQRGTQKDQNA